MVHPFNPREPTTVPDSWIVSVKKGGDLKVLVNEIDWLIGGSRLEGSVKIARQDPKHGFVTLKCDDEFIEKVKQLPSCGAVEPERRVYIMSKGGPKP